MRNITKSSEKFKKIIVSLLVMTIFFSPMLAVPARAQWVDIVQSAKEMGLDTVAWMVVNRVIERLTASTVNWINSGFKGSPAYVSDRDAYFKDLADKAAGQFIFANPNLNFLCGPISAKIRLALAKNYVREPYWQCTLTQVGMNMQDFMNDFRNGGWDSFFEISQRQHMNPLGAYLQAEGELVEIISRREETKQKELDWGRGFMSYQKCKRYAGSFSPVAGSGTQAGTKQVVCTKFAPLSESNPGSCLEYEETTTDSEGNVIASDDLGPEASGACLEYETVTPGSVIQDRLEGILGIGEGKLKVADEFNEIVSALLNQLVAQVIGGVGKGLKGLSQPSSTSGGQLFTSQLSSNTQNVGYFCFDQSNDPNAPYYVAQIDPNNCINQDMPNTSLMNVPPPDPASMFPQGAIITIPPAGGSSCNPEEDPNCP